MYRFRITDPHFLPHLACDVELELRSGEILAITGENGIGKSTLVQRIFREHSSSITLVEQSPMDFFYDRNLATIKKIFLECAEKVDHAFFHELWNLFNLDKKEDRYQSSLSGGESQALKLCLGLSVERDLYFLDEPSQYIDANIKLRLNDVLSNLIRKNKALVIVEHDLTWIKTPLKVCQLEMNEGTLRKGRVWST